MMSYTNYSNCCLLHSVHIFSSPKHQYVKQCCSPGMCSPRTAICQTSGMCGYSNDMNATT